MFVFNKLKVMCISNPYGDYYTILILLSLGFDENIDFIRLPDQ